MCSGIEAATVAWHPLGWEPVAFSEIEAFPSAVLAHHYPEVPNVGDMTKYKEWNLGAVDILVGGTPCQSFSVAGLRKGLEDPRGNLALVYCGILDHLRPKWFVWENVPGVLSSGGGRDFGSFLGALAELGYGFAYRVLDAQYFGVAQRRRRVFVVGHLGDWRPAAEVLFEPESVRGNPAPSRKARQEVTECVGTLTANGGGLNRPAGNANELDFCVTVAQPFPVANTLTARMHKGMNSDCNEGQTPVVQPVNIYGGNKRPDRPEGGFYVRLDEQTTKTLDAASGLNPTCSQGGTAVMQSMAVRRLTPVECERLQGFPDEYTAIPWRTSTAANCPDGPRYKALGNSMAVPVMAWIGRRIQERTT